MELTQVERDILTALINIYRKENRPVRSEKIAKLIDRNPGTVRNQMQSLRALNLVQGVSGPKVGYKATSSAYEALNLDGTDDTVLVPITRNGFEVDGATASEIVFNKVMKSNVCNGTVRIIGDVKDFDVGDKIRIGPTPVNKMFVGGVVEGVDDTMSQLIFHVTEIISIPRIPVKNVVQRAVHIEPNATLQEAARILIYNGVRDALVDGISPGLVSMTDITRAMADGRIDLKVSEITTYDFLTIDSSELIFKAVRIFGRDRVNQIVVTDSGVHWGIITPADLVRTLVLT
jgi:predicted transcriptional regulator